MKKILAIAMLTLTMNANAFWNNNNMPWDGGVNNYNGHNQGYRHNGYNQGYGYQRNNGFIAHNPFSMFSPDWMQEEMNDFVDEFDNNGRWGNNNNPWHNNNFNNFNNMP
jgi:hypothetical protein